MVALCICVRSASLIHQLYFMERRLICHTSFCPRSGPEAVFISHAVILLSLLLIVFLSLLVVVIVTYSLSCAHFKKYYALVEMIS